jgi:putative DNA primase/helicase
MAVPNLRTPEGQGVLECEIIERDLVVFDNVATLFRDSVDQNAASSWVAAQEYALRLRRRGIAVLLIDHDGKALTNRGTSAKQDVLDTVIHLKHPKDYLESQGARFDVIFSKHRGFSGRDAMPFEARLIDAREGPLWVAADSEELDVERVVEMMSKGMTELEMRDALGCGGSRIATLKKKAKAFTDSVQQP